MTKIIDLSVPVSNNESEPLKIKIKRVSHQKGAESIGRSLIWSRHYTFRQNCKNIKDFLSGEKRLSKKYFPNQEFLSLEIVTLNSHAGTHMDAPAHYGSMCEGKPSRTIDQLPIDWFFHDGVLLDLTYKKGGEFITENDIKSALEKINYTLKPYDIVLIHTGNDKKWGTPAYFWDAPGMSAEATDFLMNQGIKVMGIDCYGFDRPFMAMINDFFRTKDNHCLWPAHFLGRKKEYVHMERLCNLDKIERHYDFKICCLPIKVSGLGASWVRAVAILD